MKTKICSKCKEEKDLGEFNKDKHNKDGFQYWCKSCRAEYMAEWRKNNKEHRAEYMAAWYQNSHILFNSKSKMRKQIELYEEVKQSSDGYLMVRCKGCKEWYTPTYRSVKHRVEAINGTIGGDCNLYCSDECKQACPIYNKKLYSANDLRSNTTSNPYYTQAELKVWSDTVLTRANHICEFCEEAKAVHAHHIQPKKLEPALALDPDNGIACCESCHYKYGHSGECSTGALANAVCGVA